MACFDNVFVVLFRMLVVLGVASLAAIVLLMTPLPESSRSNCNRPCHELDWPMICRFQLTLKTRKALSRKFCGYCHSNVTHCPKKHCMLGDGTHRHIIAANDLYPGPEMHVCENDILVVEVINQMAGHSATLHWRGQPLRETPSMDGVPMVTQCPVPAFTTFQYKLRASQPGTHLWQVLSGDPKVDRLFGALVVRRSNKMEPHRALYDEDNSEHLILLSEWLSKDKSTILINGRAVENEENSFSSQKFNVTSGKRYRFRVAYGTSDTGCPIVCEIASHSLLILALDGRAVESTNVTAFTIAPGERIDFALRADQPIKQYLIQFQLTDSCSKLKVKSHAFLSYNNSDASLRPIAVTSKLQNKVLSTIYSDDCRESTKMCLSSLKSLEHLSDSSPKDAGIDLQFLLQRRTQSTEVQGLIDQDDLDSEVALTVNNITFAFPPSPLLTQLDDADEEDQNAVCNVMKVPSECSSPGLEHATCLCTHVIPIPHDSSVQISILNSGERAGASDFTFHQHGYHFRVIRQGQLADYSLDALDQEKIDSNRLGTHHYVLKDTINIPKNSFVIFRFIANNPGYWFLHEERSLLWSQGMAVVLKVGEQRDYPPVPENFPKCGNWIGPEFFLA